MAGKSLSRKSEGSDPWAEWYDTYRRQRDGQAAADAALHRGLERQIGWMSGFIVVWTALVCSACSLAIWYLFS
ncbi:MAG: hypothetical protein ACRYGP_28905 [Janthinobacterium lividum]